MDGPVYKLEQVVHSKAGMEDFEGPLDLILFLLSKNKIEIQDIPISLILEQYLAYLELRQQMDLEVASEFVTMAAQLMFIKTRMLLSLEDAEAKSEMEQLVKALEERRSSENYAKIKFVTARLSEMGEFGRSILLKSPEPLERGKVYKYSHRPAELLAAWRQIGDRGERPAGALSCGKQGAGYYGPAAAGRDQLPAAVSRKPQPQRDGGHLSGGAGDVPGADHPPDRQPQRLHHYGHGGEFGFPAIIKQKKSFVQSRFCRRRISWRGGKRAVGRKRERMARDMRDLEAALEGILFAAGEPIHIDRICSSLEINRSTAEKLLGKLGDYYAFERRGIRLLQIGRASCRERV